MRHFFILFSLFIFLQDSNAGKSDGTTDADEASPNASAPKPPPAYLKFSKKVDAASQKHDAYAFPALLKKFGALDAPEKAWEAVAQRHSVQMWPSQSCWKIAVGAQCFLDAAIDAPHQSLLRNVLGPFLGWSFSKGGFDAVYAEVSSAVHETIQTHPYLRRRSSLYALAAASHLQHPLARLFLTEALRVYDGNHERFFRQNHALVTHGLNTQEGQKMLHRYIDVPGIEAFVDLREESDLQNPKKLELLATLGLPHYRILLGDMMYEKLRAPWSSSTVDPIITLYKAAADHGDSTACFKVSNLMNGASSKGLKSKHPLKRQAEYLSLSAWHGNSKAYAYSHIKSMMDINRIPGTGAGIYKNLKSFLIPKT